MSGKKPFILWNDRLVMAPWRYMDFHGRSPNVGALSNFISLPETKMMAISLGAAFALNANTRAMIPLLTTAVGVTIVRSLSQSFRAARTAHYLDTAPDKPIPLQAQTCEILRRVRPSLTRIFTGAVPMATGIAIGMKLGGYENGIVAATTAMVFMYDATRGLAVRYRIDRIIDNDWNYMVGRAPPEPTKQKEGAGLLAPAPG